MEKNAQMQKRPALKRKSLVDDCDATKKFTCQSISKSDSPNAASEQSNLPIPSLQAIDKSAVDRGCSSKSLNKTGTPKRFLNMGRSSDVRSSFKSPLREGLIRPSLESKEDVLKKIEEIKEKITEVEARVHDLQNEGYTTQQVDQHIELLHRYNDVKDAGQIILGHLAVRQGVTVQDLYIKYGLEIDD